MTFNTYLINCCAYFIYYQKYLKSTQLQKKKYLHAKGLDIVTIYLAYFSIVLRNF